MAAVLLMGMLGGCKNNSGEEFAVSDDWLGVAENGESSDKPSQKEEAEEICMDALSSEGKDPTTADTSKKEEEEVSAEDGKGNQPHTEEKPKEPDSTTSEEERPQ